MDTDKRVLQIPIEDIIPNRFQPRLAFDDDLLDDLSSSIKIHGIVQPLVLRKKADKYEIIAGERRYKAAIKSGLTSVPGIITTLSDKESAEVAIIENTQRKNLSSIEEAKAYLSLIENENMSQEELAKRMGMSQGAISNKLRLLNLTEDVQNAIINERISERHARSLLKITNSRDQIDMLNKVIRERITVKQLERIIREEYSDIVPTITENINVEEIKIKAMDINKPTLKEESNKEEFPNKFFNFLEDETASLSIEEPDTFVFDEKINSKKPESKIEEPNLENIELLDFEINQIDEFEDLKKYLTTTDKFIFNELKENGQTKLVVEIKP